MIAVFKNSGKQTVKIRKNVLRRGVAHLTVNSKTNKRGSTRAEKKQIAAKMKPDQENDKTNELIRVKFCKRCYHRILMKLRRRETISVRNCGKARGFSICKMKSSPPPFAPFLLLPPFR